MRVVGWRTEPHDRQVSAGGEMDDEDGGGPRYTVAAVARRLGVAPSTLRTWDRRYGLAPALTPSVSTGASPRRTSPGCRSCAGSCCRACLRPRPPGPCRTRQSHCKRRRRRRPDSTAAAGWCRCRAAAPDVRGLARAAMSLDAAAVTATIRRSVREHGVATTWHALVAPVLQGVGERWQATGEGVEVEHLLAESALAALRLQAPAGPERATAGAAGRRSRRAALPAAARARCCPGRARHRHPQPGRRPSRPHALAEAVRRVGPAVLFLWSSLRTHR